MDPLLSVILPYLLSALAGAAGGGVRWASDDKTNVNQGIRHVFAGGVAGTFLGGMVYSAIKPAADFSGMDILDGRLLGANIAGVIGINLYAVPVAIVRTWMRKASTADEEHKP